RTASPTERPCDNRTSTWRSFATISSGLCFFWGIPTSSYGSIAYFREDHFSGGRPIRAGAAARYPGSHLRRLGRLWRGERPRAVPAALPDPLGIDDVLCRSGAGRRRFCAQVQRRLSLDARKRLTRV